MKLPYEGKPLPDDTWTEQDEAYCSCECWGLFDCRDNVVRICAVIRENLTECELKYNQGFDTDAEAVAYVQGRADGGSAFHKKALRFHGTKVTDQPE